MHQSSYGQPSGAAAVARVYLKAICVLWYPELPRHRRIIAAICLAAPMLAGRPADAAEAPKPPAPTRTFTDCTDHECPEMVVVPAGAIAIGSTEEERRVQGVLPQFADHEGPRHLVAIAKPFAIAKFETTVSLYGDFVRETRRPDAARCAIHLQKGDDWGQQPGFNWHNPGFAQSGTSPVACVSYGDATAFIAWLSARTGKPYRLPSEAEWEYAARGGTTTARYWGDSSEALCVKANVITSATTGALQSPGWVGKLVCNSTHSFTMPVGSFDANPFGLYDMIGNVFEWVQDCYHPNYIGAPADGSAWNEPACKLHYLKGGAFHSAPYIARAATRGFPLKPDFHSFAAGFRVARSLE
jgi:formylglycine-generating enzyme required for sulfatase activity